MPVFDQCVNRLSPAVLPGVLGGGVGGLTVARKTSTFDIIGGLAIIAASIAVLVVAATALLVMWLRFALFLWRLM